VRMTRGGSQCRYRRASYGPTADHAVRSPGSKKSAMVSHTQTFHIPGAIMFAQRSGFLMHSFAI
jgi:hypothetical protein